jgi:hypothetical protein
VRPVAPSPTPDAGESATLTRDNADEEQIPRTSAVQGHDTGILAEGFKGEIPARYAVFELRDLTASHDFWRGTPAANNEQRGTYPKRLQPRDYGPGTAEESKVVRFAQEQKSPYYVSSHPGADSGPPSVSPDGTVINGNGRVMSLQLAAGRNDYAWMREAVLNQAETFGLDRAAVDAMEFPALVRVVDMNPTSKEAREFARAGNVTTTQQQSPARTAASLSGLIDAELLDSLDLSDDITFSEAVKGPAGASFRQILFEALPASVRPNYFRDDRTLTDTGAELVQNMLLSHVFPVSLIERLSTARPRMKQVIEGALPQLLSIVRDYPEGDITPQLIEALEFLSRYPEVRKQREVKAILGQQSIFGGSDETLSPAGEMVTEFLVRDGDKPRVFRERLAKAISDYAWSQGLLGEGGDALDIIVGALDVQPKEGAVFGRPVALLAAATPRRAVDRTRAVTPLNEARRTINQVVSRLSRGKNFKVLRTMGEAPEEVRRTLWKQLRSVEVGERRYFVAGFFHEGTAYFVANDLEALAAQDGLSLEAMAVAKWAHEYGLHYGLRGMLEELHGPGGRLAFKRLMRDVFAAVGREGILEAVGESYANAPNDVLAEEYLAHLAERLDKNSKLTASERTVWKRVLDFFRNALRRTLGKLTDRDIERVVLNSLRWAMNRGETNGTPDTRFSLTFGHEFQDKQKDRSENTLAARDAALRVFDKGGSVMDAWRAARRAAQEADARPYSTEGIRLAGDHGMRQAARLRGIDIEDKAFGDGWNSKEPASAWDSESKQGAIFAERPLPKLKSARGQWKKYGEPRFSIAEARRQTETPAFKRWFGQSKVAAEDGAPLVVYHGTVNDFAQYDERRGNVESDWGAGFYFSNTPEDVNENYAGEGPDLTNKIERLAERIEAEEEIPYAEARERARAELSEGRANVMPVFLSLQNPFEVGGERPEYWETEYDPEDEDAEPTGKAIDFLEALRHVAYGFDDVNTDTLSEDLSEYLYDGGKAEDMVEAARKSEGLSYATDEHGDLAGHEIIRLALERMGYDGIIDRSVNKKFGWESKQKPMLGMAQDTVHYIAFRANQIKSATGNTGAFDPTNPDIRFSAETRTGDPNVAPEAARRIEAGELASEPGKRGLANPLPDIEHLRQVYDTVQSVMDELGIPGVKRVKDTYAAAEEMDLAQVQSRMMEHARNGRTFETVEEAGAARLVLERESPKLLKENRLEELAKLIGAYNDTGTEAARILAIRREQLDLDTPEAKRSALLGQIFEPSRRLKAERDRLTRQISQEKNPGKRAVLLRRRGLVNKQMAKELERAKAILDRYGIDPERIEEAKPAVLRRVLRDVAASKHTYWDALFEWRMNWGLLSGGRSFVVDPLSTGMHAAWDATGERFVKAMLNLFVGDPLSPHLNELVTQWRGLVPGLAAGWRNAFRTLATEEPTLAASKGQKNLGETFKDRHDVAISGRKGYLVRLPSNLKAASDEFIKSVVAHMDVWAQADRLARLEGLKGGKRTQRIAELVGDGRSLAWTLALTHANYIAFQEPLKSEAGNKLMGTVHGTPLRWAFPFVKTPTNLVKLGLRKSPLGILSLVRERGKLSTEEKVARTAEQLIAWGMTVGLMAAMSGDEDEPWITGTSSWTPEERNKREAEYRFAAPYTIKLPGYGRVDYSRLEPFSTALATTVDALDNFKHNGAGVEAGNEFMHDMVGLLKDKLFLRGMSDLMDLTMDERRRPKVAADFLSSFIPNLYQQAALASDPNVRELQDAGHGRFKDRVIYSMFPTSHIPYPKVDVWGREIRKGGNAPWRAAMPINLYPDQQSDLEHKLDTLIRKYNENAPPEKQWWPSRPQPFYTKNGETHYWTDEEYHRLSALAGKYTLERLRRTRLDLDSPTGKDIERIKTALEEARERARKEVRREKG